MNPNSESTGERCSVRCKIANKRVKKISPKVILLSLAVLLVAGAWYRTNLWAADENSQEQKVFVVAKGQAADEILQKLEENGLIRSKLAVKIYLYLNKNHGSLQAGSFKLSPAMSVEEILNNLRNGVFNVWVTIPEGWRAEQIVDELIVNGLIDKSTQNEIYRQLRKEEGKLFPDTYLFAKDSSLEIIKQKMLANFENKTKGLNITDQDLVLASLIEREAKHDQDRPLIASVIRNRLKIGMALQIDATLQYALDNQKPVGVQWWRTVAAADKKVKSPYNTYLNKGLPPGSICNPGLSSIKAALNPAESDYLYYLSEDNGTTHYAKTLVEHQENIRKYLK